MIRRISFSLLMMCLGECRLSCFLVAKKPSLYWHWTQTRLAGGVGRRPLNAKYLLHMSLRHASSTFILSTEKRGCQHLLQVRATRSWLCRQFVFASTFSHLIDFTLLSRSRLRCRQEIENKHCVATTTLACSTSALNNQHLMTSLRSWLSFAMLSNPKVCTFSSATCSEMLDIIYIPRLRDTDGIFAGSRSFEIKSTTFLRPNSFAFSASIISGRRYETPVQQSTNANVCRTRTRRKIHKRS